MAGGKNKTSYEISPGMVVLHSHTEKNNIYAMTSAKFSKAYNCIGDKATSVDEVRRVIIWHGKDFKLASPWEKGQWINVESGDAIVVNGAEFYRVEKEIFTKTYTLE